MLSIAEAILESRFARWSLIALIIISVLPDPTLEAKLTPVFLVVFSAEILVRVMLLWTKRTPFTRSEAAFLAIDLIALASFLPPEILGLLGQSGRQVLRILRLARLMVLLRFFRALALDVYTVLTRREQLQQFALVTVAVVALAFGSAVLLHQLAAPHDYGVSAGTETFWDRMWWSFRQIESPDNIVSNLEVTPIVGITSFILTITGVFIFSYLIGVGGNVVEQVVKAERRRRVADKQHSLVLGSVGRAELLVREYVKIHEKNRGLRRYELGEVLDWIRGRAPLPRRHAMPKIVLLGDSGEPPSFLFDSGMKNVMYREGMSASSEAMERVGAPEAKRAILIADSAAGDDADALTIAALGALRDHNSQAHVFVEVLDAENKAVVSGVGGEGTFPIEIPRLLGLFLCHHLICRGADALFEELLTAAGSEFYTHLYVDPSAQRRWANDERDVDFAAVARWAHQEHRAVILGCFVGETPLERSDADLIPVADTRMVLNPSSAGERVRRCDVRGWVAVAETYTPLRRVARDLVFGAEPLLQPAAETSEIRFELDPEMPKRVLILGYSRSAEWLIRGLDRFEPGVEITLVLNARKDARRSLNERLRALRLGIDTDAARSREGARLTLERGARFTCHAQGGSELVQFARERLDGEAPFDSVVFLSDPDSLDADARTCLRVHRFLKETSIRTTSSPVVLVELVEVDAGERLKTQTRDSFDRLTVVSTERIRSYFMVHSAFVPGSNRLYDQLLGHVGQDLVRLSVDLGGQPRSFTELFEGLLSEGWILVAVRTLDGETHTNPPSDRIFGIDEVECVFAVGERDLLVSPERQSRPPAPLPHPVSRPAASLENEPVPTPSETESRPLADAESEADEALGPVPE